MTENRNSDSPEIFTSADILRILINKWKIIVGMSLICAGGGYLSSYAVTPTFVSTNTFLPPQNQGNNAISLASLGALSGLVNGSTLGRNSADQYVALMQSVTIADKIVDKFKLLEVYDVKFKETARIKLAKYSQISAGKKDGLIRVEVRDVSPQRAADIANQYVEELRRITSSLAITEAQQRRVFFEKMLADTKAKLNAAQYELENSGISSGLIKSEPKSAAEGYAKLQADLTIAQVRLQVLKGTLANGSPQLRQQEILVSAIKEQLSQLEKQKSNKTDNQDYIGKYREYKYQETLFDLFSKQYEVARVDESRDGTIIQEIDKATPAEIKSTPRRLNYAIAGMLAGIALTVLYQLRIRRPTKHFASRPRSTLS